MLRKSLINDFVLNESFLEKKSHKAETWLAIPVELYSVFVSATDTFPALFSSLILRLLKTGATTVAELNRITGLDQQLLSYILNNELHKNVRFSGDHIMIRDKASLEKLKFSYAPLREYQIFKVVSTGKFIPRPFTKFEEVWREPAGRDDKMFPIFSFRKSKGSPERRIAPIILPVMAIGSKRQEATDSDKIIASWKSYLKDYDASINYHGDDETRNYAGKRHPYVRNIHSINLEQKAYILTTIMLDEEDKDGWSCSDPFCVYQERGLSVLKEPIELFCEERSQLSKIITGKIGAIIDDEKSSVGHQRNRNRDSIRFQRAEDKVIERYGHQLPETLQGYITTLMLKEEEFLVGPVERHRERTGDLLIHMQKTLESLFKNLRKRVSPTNSKRFKGKLPHFRDRIEVLSVILQNLGAINEDHLVSRKLSSDSVWRSASYEETSLKSLLLQALYSANQNNNHPLRKALELNPSIPADIIIIADRRNKFGGHGSGNMNEPEPGDEEIGELVEKTHFIAEIVTRNWEN